MKIEKHPNYLAAIDHKRERIFVLAPPHLSALKVNGKWQHIAPLDDSEIPHFSLVTDYNYAEQLINEARTALEGTIN